MKNLILVLAIAFSATSQALELHAMDMAVEAYNEQCGTNFTRKDIVEESDLDSDWDFKDVLLVLPAEGWVSVQMTKGNPDEWDFPTFDYEVIEVFCSVDL